MYDCAQNRAPKVRLLPLYASLRLPVNLTITRRFNDYAALRKRPFDSENPRVGGSTLVLLVLTKPLIRP